MISKYAEIFCWKNVSSFCSAKATHIFSAKNISILYIESAKTVNEMTLNELVKLTTLWTTGPGCLINVQVQGQPLLDSWLAATMADLTPDLQVCLSWGPRASTLCNPSLSAASMLSWASQAHAFHQPVCERLSWLHHWSVPHVHTSEVFSPSEWGPDPQS